MIIRHHDFEKVTVLASKGGRTLLAARHATLHVREGTVTVSVWRPQGGYDNVWTALAEVVSMAPWWCEIKVRAAIDNDLVEGTLYALVVDDGLTPAHWPQGVR